MAKGDKLARGRITIVNLNDGADAVVIYTRSQFQPTTPTGANPAGWNAIPSTYDNNYWTLWASSAKKNADGTISGTWSTPIPAEIYDSNALNRFPFVVGSGNQPPYAQYSSTDNIREVGLNPFGVSDVLWRGKSQISTGWCGGFNLSSYVPVDTNKLYRFACWFKRSTFTEGYLYFGLQGTVQSGTTWADNANFYFFSGTTMAPCVADKWYLVVGYVYPSTSETLAADIRAGVYDPVTGNRIIIPATTNFCRHKSGINSLGFRISQYNCTTTNPETRFWQPRIDLCDGREPSIEELLKKNPLQPTVTISGDTVFKFIAGQSVPTATSITFSASLLNGLTTYQWQYNTGGSWVSISGATAATYALTHNYAAWGALASLRLRCASTLAGVTYYSNEITVTKLYDGATGPPGVDANLLDWVADWNSAKTVIDANSVITPKIFAGVKNANNTVTGVALGRFSMSARNDAGTIITETIDGIYGFRDGYKTFFIDSGGNAQLGRGNQSIKYNAVTGKVEFGSDVALAWVGATYIDASGIFTGTLSANTVNAIRINASQINAGTIDASRIDTVSLKATLITAGNIEALTLNVTKGKIGGWNIDADSIYLGTNNNTSGAYTAASGAMTIGSTGIRGYKWRLDSTGAGAVAGGNIAWDATGAVTFAASVSLNWTTPIGNINTALGGASFPKLTNISSTGIYTGTLTASQITAGTISADRIAAGSINSTKLDAASIQANIINTTYINGLTCTFVRGTIGGWTINSGSLSNSQIVLDNTNKRIGVYGASSSMTSGQRTMLYYNSNSDFGLYASDSSGTVVAQLGSVNKIAGWNINASQIYKNSVYLGADGSIANSGKWALNNDGSGSIASGNISWNTAGVITFSAAVTLNWKNDIEAAQKANFGYPYYKRIVINGDANNYYPVVIKGGDQNFKRDILIRRGYNEQAPDTWNTATHKGGLVLLLKTNFGGWGGMQYSWDIYELSEVYSRMFAGAEHCGNCCMFSVFLRGGGTTGAVYHLYSDQPLELTYMSESPVSQEAPQICYNSDLIFKSGSTLAYASAPRTLTAAVEEEIRRRRFINLAQSSDTTLTQHPLTYIGSTGIYTGTLTAAQVNAVAISAGSITTGTLSADRIAVGSINSTKLDAASIQANIINTTYINGLSCSFIRGTIGGFTIGSDNMSIGSIGATGQTPIQIRSASVGSGYWYSGAYKPLGITLTWLQSSNAGHIVFGQIAASGSTVKTGFIGIQMMAWDNTEYFCLSANSSLSGSKEVYNRIAGWAFDNASIWKNNVQLGSDGSIYNGTKWKLNNDGSGQIANGNISWNAAGTVTFASSVSLNWTNAANDALNSAKTYADTKKTEAINTAASDATSKADAAKELASAMAYGRMIYRDPTFFNGTNSINIYNNSGNGTVTISRISDNNAPNDSKLILRIQNTGAASPECGGFHFSTATSNRKIFITRIIAKIPSGRTINFATNSIGTGGDSKWLTSNAGTGDWCEYIYKVVCGTSNFSSTNFYYITGAAGVTWDLAYATVFDVTSVEKFTTTIDANGIYTGTLNANQITAGTIEASRIDTNSIKSAIITAGNINALTLTIDKGTIGGWSINSYQISKNSVALSSDGSIVNGTKWKLNNDGSGQLANGNITWDTAGNITARGAVFNNVRIQGSVRNPFVLNDSSIWIGGDSSNQQNFNNYDNIVAVRGSWDEYISLPWTLANSGRRVTLVNYKWGSNTTVGYMTIYAPYGQYFFEDGIQKSSITFSRELVELLGYGDSSTFFGWIVINRRDIMTSGKYGSYQQVLANGIVTLSGTTPYLKYKTFDGGTISVSRTAVGRYTVYLPWNLDSKYFVLMTGYYTATPIYATVMGIYSSYFQVQTQDDSSANEGSFCFQVISTADWS